ncbi:MAG: head GIN domain-containing protein [Flavobacteriales bacterium]
MRASTRLLAALPLLFTLQACDLANCVQGSGSPSRRTVDLPEFDGIVAEGSIDVRVTRAAVQRVDVEAQENLFDLVITEVKDGALHVGTKDCIANSEPITVHISLPTLTAVTVQGSGDLTSSDRFTADAFVASVQGSGSIRVGVEARKVQAAAQGSGDIDLSGRCDDLEAHVQGSGTIEAKDLHATNVDASVQGSGDINVHATGLLAAHIGGSGDITHTGPPKEVKKAIAGSGEVKQVP